ncbi:hypothetical protein FSP39_013581 [Pinctada imbricata]|uniref:SAM domain-containing protein n=1 Tax=Pinctada imbricata TaxID=66713 RepID=A0AA89BPL0_PINIB|nr:hypothetical protein FSP39_013581 [Pinctada imbricata]
MSTELGKAEAALVDTDNPAALERFYTILLEDLAAIRDSLETMRQEKDEKSQIFVVLETEISDRLRNVNEWLEIARKSSETGNLKLYISVSEFRRLNKKVSVEIQSLINMTRGERSDGFERLRYLFSDLQSRIEDFENLTSITMTGNNIKIDKNGAVLECSRGLENYSFTPWTTEERQDNLPTLENRMFLVFESDVFYVYINNERHKEVRWKDKILIKVKRDENAIVEDRSWTAMIRFNNEWKTEEATKDGDFLVFRSDAVESFFILSAPKEKEFFVSPTGCQYKHKADDRIEINFPEGAVDVQQHFKVQVFPVKVEEMKIRRATFPKEYHFVSLSKGVHVDGKLNQSVELKLPLETIDEEAMKDDKDLEIVSFHVVGDNVEVMRNTQYVKKGNIVSTSVKSFSIIVHGCVRRDSMNSASSMEALIGLGFMHHCKLLTLFNKTNERFIKIWCELVKKEDADRILNDRLQSEENLGKIDGIPKDVFIREEERIRVDITGNSEINKAIVKMASLLITFIPIADQNHIFIPVDKKAGGAHYTTITYSKDRFGKGPLHSASFDPWSKKNTSRSRPGAGYSSDPQGGRYNAPPVQQQPSVSRQISANKQNPGPSTSTTNTSVIKGSDSAQTTTDTRKNQNPGSATPTLLRERTEEKSSDFEEVAEFDQFFITYKLDDMKQKFVKEKFDRMDTMVGLTEDDLKELQLKMGERKLFMNAINNYKQKKNS